MKLYVGVLLLAGCIVAQNYREIEVTTNATKFNDSIKNNQELYFALKGCSPSMSASFYDKSGEFLYRSTFKPDNNMIILYQSSINIQIQYSANNCSKFEKFKLRWTDGKLRLWHYLTTAKWNLVGEFALLSVNTVHSFRFFSAAEVTWKVFIEEHTTDPFRVTCVRI